MGREVSALPEALLGYNATATFFGTTAGGGANGVGTVFELTNTEFVVDPSPTAGNAHLFIAPGHSADMTSALRIDNAL